MGNFTRRGAAAALLAAGAMVLTPLTALADDDSDLIEVDGTPEYIGGDDVAPDIYRFAGRDRVATSVDAANRVDFDGGHTAIIATTATFADALAAAPLADELNAPVLLNDPGNVVDNRVMGHLGLASRGYTDVVIVGGDDVFGEGFVQQLEDAGFDVTRYAGANRYQTALALAQATVNAADLERPNIFLADGTDFADALAAGAAAANHDGVVLLTNGSKGIDTWTNAAIMGTTGRYGPELENHTALIAVGGPAVVAAANGWQGEALEIDRQHVGKNRYQTAVLLAERYPGDGVNFTIASGENFPDAVVAGAFAGNIDGPLLLTKEDRLTKVTGRYLESIREGVNNVFVFGGPDSISKQVSLDVHLLNWTY